MTTTAELLATFEQLSVSMRNNAARIEQTANAQGIPIGDLQITIDSLIDQAERAEATAQELRDGDAVSIDDALGR